MMIMIMTTTINNTALVLLTAQDSQDADKTTGAVFYLEVKRTITRDCHSARHGHTSIKEWIIARNVLDMLPVA